MPRLERDPRRCATRWAARAVALAVACLGVGGGVRATGALYGTVITDDGRQLTGTIRWDSNENFQDDRIDAELALPGDPDAKPGREFSVSLFGLKLGGGESRPPGRPFSIALGHVATIERTGEALCRLTTTGGDVLDVVAAGSDLGPAVRDIVVDDADRGTIALAWAELDRVTFAPAPDDAVDRRRLWGTMTSGDRQVIGFVVWDRDESLAGDELDGEADDGDHSIPFAEIREIVRQPSSSRVVLADGTAIVLGGTNDVASGHRGVAVAVPGAGVVSARWRDVDRVSFGEPPVSPGREAFDDGGPLEVRIALRGGDSLAGRLLIDGHELWSFEALEGHDGPWVRTVPYDAIATIERLQGGAARVMLRAGGELRIDDGDEALFDRVGIVVPGRRPRPLPRPAILRIEPLTAAHTAP